MRNIVVIPAMRNIVIILASCVAGCATQQPESLAMTKIGRCTEPRMAPVSCPAPDQANWYWERINASGVHDPDHIATMRRLCSRKIVKSVQ